MYKSRAAPQHKRADLKVLVEVEVTSILIHLLWLAISSFLVRAGHDAGFLVIADALLEEVGFASEGYRLHEVEGVGRIVDFLIPEGEEETVGDELDVLLHERGVHAEQCAGESIGQELLLDRDGLGDDVLYGLLAWAVVEVRKEEASEVGVKTLVTGDQLV